MPSLDRAELSSLSAQVDELARRVAILGEGVQASDEADLAAPLFEAERSLQMARRALDRAQRDLAG